MATGMSVPNSPKFPGSQYVLGYEQIGLQTSDYVGKNVLILGRGEFRIWLVVFELNNRIINELLDLNFGWLSNCKNINPVVTRLLNTNVFYTLYNTKIYMNIINKTKNENFWELNIRQMSNLP